MMETHVITSPEAKYNNNNNNMDTRMAQTKPPKRPDSLYLVPRGGSLSELDSSPSPVTSSPCFAVRGLRTLPSVEEELVKLPKRYMPKRRTLFPGLRELGAPSVEELDTENKNEEEAEESRDWKEREADMDTAIKWIKQEIGILKSQDRMLMRQLLELRATIHQLRGARTCYTSGSDLSSTGGSWASLEDGSMSAPCMDYPLTERDLLNSFQARAVSMMSVLPSPSPARHRRHIPKGNSFEIISLH